MNRIQVRRLLLTLSFIAIAPCVAMADHHNALLPRVLLIRDSVSIGYTNYVKVILLGKMEVSRPLNANGGYQNCEGTTSGLKNIDTWIGDGGWDVIHFNFGLHDWKHVVPETGKNSRDPAHPQQANLAEYEENFNVIVGKLKATGAKLVFATTTPYDDDPGGPLRRADQPVKYNAVAKKLMEKHGIVINDLYHFTLPRMKELMPPRNEHF